MDKEPSEETGAYRSTINSLSLTILPTDKITVTAYGSFQDIRLTTPAAQAVSTTIGRYDGDTLTWGIDAKCELAERTKLSTGFSQTVAETVFDHTFIEPYVEVSHEINDTWSVSGRYVFTRFDEHTNGNIDDYSGSTFVVGITGKF